MSEDESEMAARMSEGEDRAAATMLCDGNGSGYSEGESYTAVAARARQRANREGWDRRWSHVRDWLGGGLAGKL
jgi:hypothetical protein